jgi:ElaB/YqjD/DUF883 family membrane-anchored ribosome-binding protein
VTAVPRPISAVELRLLIGRAATDIYGRKIGRVVALSLNTDDELQSIQIQPEGGQLLQYPRYCIMLYKDDLVLLPQWKVETEAVRRELNFTERRVNALNELMNDKELPREVYEEFRRSQEAALVEIRRKGESLLHQLKERVQKTADEVAELTSFLVGLKLEFRAGEMDKESLDSAYKAVEPSLNAAVAEKQDIENALTELSRLCQPQEEQYVPHGSPTLRIRD